MAFSWEGKTPEGYLSRSQQKTREVAGIESVSTTYERQAKEMLAGPDADAVHDEIARFVERIQSSRDSVQREDGLMQLLNALKLRKVSGLADIPDEAGERNAFALALVHAYQKSLQ